MMRLTKMRLTKFLQINMAVPLHEPASSRYSVSVAASEYPSFTEEQLSAMRGGLPTEEYRWKLIREFLKESPVDP